MQQKKVRLTIMSVLGGLFLIIDQVLKYIARSNTDFTYYLYKNWVGWGFFKNPGIAFSIEIPIFVVIFLTPLVLLFLSFYFLKEETTTIEKSSLLLIIVGAISNYIDRVLFGYTIDYIRLYTSIINIADIMIVSGVFVLIKHNLFKNK